jgi:signal recognition particle subunit SEC65
VELEDLSAWLERMPDNLVSNLYKGLGGQPNRVATVDRMIHLAVRAIAQGSRISSLLKGLSERDRKALASLLQCGGIAHATEFQRELILSFGGHDREWKRVLSNLADKGLVAASTEADGQFFYIIPQPLTDGLLDGLSQDLSLPVFSHEDVRVIDEMPFTPPLDFSITSLATYFDQASPRLTQRHEIYRHDKEELDSFFGQIWAPDSDLFSFHLDFLMMHGLVELRGEYLALNRDATEEWLQLENEDQRDLLFRALDSRFSMAEWVLWAVQQATQGDKNAWVAEHPLVALYRRWQRGEDWRKRYSRGTYAATRSSERESYSFSALVQSGILEMGRWGQEKFYRLSARGRYLLEPREDDGFAQFYLTPSFEIMAPAGLAPILLFRIGELAELTGCDRANTYRITETSIDRALERGWRRDEVLQFLRDNSQIGLPENVEQTLKAWIGHRGDVEFHDLMMLTVHRSQIRRFEGQKKLKPYVLHRFAPGLYAVDRARKDEIAAALRECGFSPSKDVRNYPGDPEQVEARQNLHKLVAEARAAIDPINRGQDMAAPETLRAVPGTRGAAAAPKEKIDKIPTDEVRRILDKAMSRDEDVQIIYLSKTGQRLTLRVQPQRLAFKADAPVLVGLDRDEDTRRTYLLDRIEGLKVIE